MTPAAFYEHILKPAASNLGAQFPTLAGFRAEYFLLAVAGQESAWIDRVQAGGPARGFWQCEQGGMLRGVMSGQYASMLERLCDLYAVPNDEGTVFEALAWHDTLAYAVARLGLFMDPHALPALNDEAGAWGVYLRAWQPGKPSRNRWSIVYGQAMAALTE